jgi:hypothetical protein
VSGPDVTMLMQLSRCMRPGWLSGT